MELDHVIVAVADLDVASRAFESRHGLTTVEGGRHLAWGTANRIVPLGSSYVELVAVVDPRRADTSPFGRWVARSPVGPMGWVVRTSSLDAVAERLDLDVASGSRDLATGGVLRWRLAGIEQASSEPCLPFFLEWGPNPFPGGIPVDHPAGNAHVARVELEGAAGRVARWVDTDELPIVVRPGEPRVARLLVEADGREISIGPSV